MYATEIQTNKNAKKKISKVNKQNMLLLDMLKHTLLAACSIQVVKYNAAFAAFDSDSCIRQRHSCSTTYHVKFSLIDNKLLFKKNKKKKNTEKRRAEGSAKNKRALN